jgi:hypothetical protein
VTGLARPPGWQKHDQGHPPSVDVRSRLRAARNGRAVHRPRPKNRRLPAAQEGHPAQDSAAVLAAEVKTKRPRKPPALSSAARLAQQPPAARRASCPAGTMPAQERGLLPLSALRLRLRASCLRHARSGRGGPTPNTTTHTPRPRRGSPRITRGVWGQAPSGRPERSGGGNATRAASCGKTGHRAARRGRRRASQRQEEEGEGRPGPALRCPPLPRPRRVGPGGVLPNPRPAAAATRRRLTDTTATVRCGLARVRRKGRRSRHAEGPAAGLLDQRLPALPPERGRPGREEPQTPSSFFRCFSPRPRRSGVHKAASTRQRATASPAEPFPRLT